MLNDDTLLENVRFKDMNLQENVNQAVVTPLDQAVILGLT